GGHEWENVVSACIPCNHKKAGRTPREAGIKLLQRPYAPPSFLPVPDQYLRANQQWLKFIPQ
ncbi:MAG: HNH endonuclease, partial [Chloroflexota bacterium]